MNQARRTLLDNIDQCSRESLVHVLSEIVSQASDHQVTAITRVFAEHLYSLAKRVSSRKRKYISDNLPPLSLFQLVSDDIVESRIFPYLDIPDHCMLASTCRHLYTTSGCPPPRILFSNKSAWDKPIRVPRTIDAIGFAKLTNFAVTRSISIDFCDKLYDNDFRHLQNLPLEVLSIANNKITDAALKYLTGLTLLSLKLDAPLITDAGLAHLSKLPLDFLSLRGSMLIHGWGFCYLRDAPLIKLELYIDHFQESNFVHLIDLPLLSMDYLGYIGTNGISYLAKMKLRELRCDINFSLEGLCDLVKLPLKEMNLTPNPHVDDLVLKAFSSMSRIHSMWLCSCDNITNNGLAHLKQLKLKHLNLSNCNKISDEGVAHLKTHPLESLELGGCTLITDKGLVHLTDMKLRFLQLRQLGITESGIRLLDPSFLESLDVSECNVLTNQFLRDVLDFPILKCLRLSGCNFVTDRTVALFSHLTLEQLGLDRTQVTDACFITDMPSLKELCLDGCDNITDVGLRRFSARFKLIDDYELYCCGTG